MNYKELQESTNKHEFKKLISEVELRFNDRIEDNAKRKKEQLLKTSLKTQDVVLVAKIIDVVGINHKPTNEIYKIYTKLCSELKVNSMSAIGFSKFIVKWFDYSIINKSIAGKKRRIFFRNNG